MVSQHGLQVSGLVVSKHALQVSRPTPKGEVEGSGLGGLQAHIQGKLRGLAGGLQAHTGGGLQTHTRGRVHQHALMQTPSADGYCCGQYASYWNAFLSDIIFPD